LVVLATVGAQAAVAASAPSASTGSAQAVSTTSAMLTGTVNPQGQDTSYHFEYGTTSAYGTSTTSNSAGSGTSDVSASAAIGSLAPGTTYHYRLVASSTSGKTPGSDVTFTTAPSPPGVSTGAAKSVSATAATLTGTVHPNGQETTYHFEYGTSTAYGSSTSSNSAGNGTSGVSASAAIGSLTPNTTYHYRLVATNGSGTTSGGDAAFTTAKRLPVASTHAANSVTTTAARVTGAVNPEGQPTTYFFEYGTNTSYGSHTAQASAGSGSASAAVAAPLGSLSPGTTYHYRLVATNGSGTARGSDRAFTTAKAPAVPIVSTGTAKAVKETSATLRGAVNPHGSATSYYFQYGTTTGYESRTSSKRAGDGGKSVSVDTAIAGLSPGTTYHYRIVAGNHFGTSLGADRVFTTIGPSRVTLGASPGTIVFGQSSTLAGNVVTSKPARTTVTLQRSRSAFGPFVNFATTTTATNGAYSFGPRVFGVSSYFRVVAGGVKSPTVHVGVRFRVSLFVNNARPRPGQLVRFHGIVVPPRNFHLVAVQRFGANHRWNTIRLVRLHRAPRNVSAYGVSLRIHRGGLWRVLIGPGPSHARGFSRVVSIRLRRP
jgi:phosphodiesterase/alkaline phosphatase D-like protein